MKGTKGFGTRSRGPGGHLDLGSIFDEIFEAARDFQDEFRRSFDECGGRRPEDASWIFDENTDYYPNYSYPPMNVYMTGDRSLIFEFALAGFDEKDISLSFQGDYMAFQAQMPQASGGSQPPAEADSRDGAPHCAAAWYGEQEIQRPEENVRYFKRRLKMKDIEKQKYYVPLDKYSQDKVKAVFRNGILKVSIPPKDEPEQNDGVKIEIVTESE